MGTPSMKLLSSASEQNVFFTYVCLVGNIKPSDDGYSGSERQHAYDVMDNEAEEIDFEDDDTMKVERSQALHEMIHQEDKRYAFETDTNNLKTADSPSNPQTTESKISSDSHSCDPKLLELTRMKWLTESQDGSPDASPALSPTESCTSSECEDINESDASDRFLSTILRLDREHNLFGLSNRTIVGPRLSKKIRKDENKAVFHQTAIVQICYQSCCRHKSNTQLPASLRCNRCRACCTESACSSCVPAPSCTSFCRSPCPSVKSCCPSSNPSCATYPPIIWPAKCPVECSNCYGLEIKINRKQKFDPIYPEKLGMSPCVLHKPMMARTCTHVPRCIPPTSCCPYVMPCYWPGRETAPCSEPSQCFHNPPCRKARVPHSSCIVTPEKCPTMGHTCAEVNKKCENMSCLGRNNEALKKMIDEKYGQKRPPAPPPASPPAK